ncbi:MAG: hypothetical protein H6740_25785 [Alphaproteobacteria bacterium]|nr:hypothetical protein [Alphaproteobacteria bacterium]
MSPRAWPWIAAALTLGVCMALQWPLPLELGRSTCPSAFGDSHAWILDQSLAMLLGERPRSPTFIGGYPYLREARYIGLGVLPVGWASSALAGPVVAGQLVVLLSLPATALGAWPLLRRWTEASPSAVAAACASFALCPFLLSTLAITEVPKLQAWTLPLALWAMDKAAAGERFGWALTLSLVALTGFTSPYYGLTLPLLAVGLAGLRAWQRRVEGPRGLLGPAVATGCTALGLLPVYAYHALPQGVTQTSLFRPAQAGQTGAVLPLPHPVATPQDLLTGPTRVAELPTDAEHVAYLGLALLLGTLALWGWRRARAEGTPPGWRLGVALLVAGVLLAMGPHLAWGERFTGLPLPGLALLKLGYPFAKGGMWFRNVVLASLGLSVMLAAVSTASTTRWAWVLLALHVADGARASGEWPRLVQPIPGRLLLQEMRTERWPVDGAVLHLPLQSEPGLAGPARVMRAALLHGRPTTGMPRDFVAVERLAVERLVKDALLSPDPAAALRAEGFRYVIWEPAADGSTAIRLELLARRLGEPKGSPLFAVWDLGPTSLKPRPLGPEMLPRGR